MIGVLFDIFAWLANTAWSVLGAVLSFVWRLLSAGADLLFRMIRSAASVLFGPMRLWDGAWDLGGVFVSVLSTLLIACAVLALVAVGENLYRRWRGR
ncbi:hypothetical protein [Acutalibacter intestini]|uniref:hypothetical protein n=1 Tax=Acutalibacter intestini TaxID=3093659 RepID=UPI002AC955DD|nr:hypothetical protein [Acutalibacter sp. M00204]